MGEFDIGRFLETGGKYAYEILSEEKKYKKKMDEIEAKIKGEREEEEKKRQANLQEGIFTGFVSLLGDPDVDAFTKRAIYQGHLLPVLTGMGQATPTQAGTTMPGGTAGVEGLPPLRPEDVAGAGALFEAPAEEPKAWHPTTEEKYRETKKFEAGLKGPSVAERKLGMDAVSVAALIRQGLRTERTALGEKRFNLTSKQRAIDFAGEMGWTKDTPEYQQHIAPAVEEWWGRYNVEEVSRMKTDKVVRKKVKKILKGSDRDATEENISIFIEKNWQRLKK